MLQDAHSRKISAPISAAPGDTILVPFATDEWHYIHEVIGGLSVSGDVTLLAIDRSAAERVFASFIGLAAGQGITENDEPGEDNRPRFEVKPGEDFVIRVTNGTFTGGIHYSIRR